MEEIGVMGDAARPVLSRITAEQCLLGTGDLSAIAFNGVCILLAAERFLLITVSRRHKSLGSL